MRDRSVEFFDEIVDTPNNFGSRMRIHQIIVFKFFLQTLPIARVGTRSIIRGQQDGSASFFNVPAKFSRNLWVLNKLVQLANQVMALDCSYLDLGVAGGCSAWNFKVLESAHAPLPTAVILEVGNANTLRNELV